MINFQVVILACSDGRQLYPLTLGGAVECLLPVGLRPALSYPLQVVQDAGLSDAIVVVAGEQAASSVKSWLAQQQAPSGIHCKVITIPEGGNDIDGLAAALAAVTTDIVVVMDTGVITDVSLRALVCSHYVGSAVATVALIKRKASASKNTKPGKAPKHVDYTAVDDVHSRLLFYASEPEALKDVQVPRSVLKHSMKLSITTDYIDTHLYVFSRPVFSVLEGKSNMQSVQRDLLPFLVRHQFVVPLKEEQARASSKLAPSSSEQGTNGDTNGDLRHGEFHLDTFMIEGGEYCARIRSVQTYADMNKELASPELCSRLVGVQSTKQDSYVHQTVELGNKATIASSCMVGEGTQVGDRSSIKRAVIGKKCRIGNNVKIINSVLLDGVKVGDSCHVQNSVIGAGSIIGDQATLRDCQVGPDQTIPHEAECRDEVLPRPQE
ncbi:unnamed protein product [Ostreobium quekettii]|uniref:Translation initiation factor eIF2B subunit gamma n=1 Tax=Ostreobium quekettii TaxID=121088 RepID=A0A8S1IP44_9CHLO|nr:unnamed protein product [Ostreobium quekettii]|eukprot:evm.model.scf_1392.2 EVM.evm.TU.scf_1392.2   scf_1392:9403-15051(+)